MSQEATNSQPETPVRDGARPLSVSPEVAKVIAEAFQDHQPGAAQEAALGSEVGGSSPSAATPPEPSSAESAAPAPETPTPSQEGSAAKEQSAPPAPEPQVKAKNQQAPRPPLGWPPYAMSGFKFPRYPMAPPPGFPYAGAPYPYPGMAMPGRGYIPPAYCQPFASPRPMALKLRVAFAGGGTGGHLYPALAVADILRSQGARLLFFDSQRGIGSRVLERLHYPMRIIWASGWTGNFWERLGALAQMGVGLMQSIFHLLRFQPHVLVASGGYVCAPVSVAAWLLGIPILLLEQNAIAGKSANFVARLAAKVCVSFPGQYRGIAPSKLLLTGNPIRSAIVRQNREHARHCLHVPAQRPLLLVVGGSQGASSLNEALIQALPKLVDQEWTIIHLTGAGHIDEVLNRTRDLVAGRKLDYRPLAYTEDMASLYAAADLVLCRAGATTLAEICARGLPSILVPYPHAAENHQQANAEVLARQKAALIVPDSQVGELLAPTLLELMPNTVRLQAMGGAARLLGRPQAAELVAQQIWMLALKRSRTLRRCGHE